MPAERADRWEVAGLAAAAAVVCCGVPALLAVAGGAKLAGPGLGSWLLVGAGWSSPPSPGGAGGVGPASRPDAGMR
jgi:hypothetical protein